MLDKCSKCSKEDKDSCPLTALGIGGIITSCNHFDRFCKGDCSNCQHDCELNLGMSKTTLAGGSTKSV